MKDKNGIKICCKNCNDDVAINCLHYNPDNPDEDWGCVVSGGFTPSYDALFARIAELQAENKRLLDCLTEHHILHPDVQKAMDRLNALADKREGLKPKCEVFKEQSFTIEEIDFIKKAISMAIIDCETNTPKPSDEKLKLMWNIKSKCDAFLKVNVRENRTLEECEEMSTQSTNVCDVSKNSKNSTESEVK